jgi:hypothetical protein
MTPMRIRLAWLPPALYAIAFVGSAIWACSTYFGPANTEREQLLPGFVFNIVCLPSSLLMDRFIDWYPQLQEMPALLYLLLVLMGLLQFVFLVWLCVGWKRRPRQQ